MDGENVSKASDNSYELSSFEISNITEGYYKFNFIFTIFLFLNIVIRISVRNLPYDIVDVFAAIASKHNLKNLPLSSPELLSSSSPSSQII